MPTTIASLPTEVHLQIASIVYSFTGADHYAIFKALRAIPLWRELSTIYGFRNPAGHRVIFEQSFGWFFPTIQSPSGRYIIDLKGRYDIEAAGQCQCEREKWLGSREECFWCVEDGFGKMW